MNPTHSNDTTQRKWLVFILVALAVFMSTLDSSIVNIALPVIMKDFKVPLSTVEWVVLIYLLTVSSLLLTFGRLSDIRGRRWVYCRGFTLFSAGSFMCAVAPGPYWLIIARSFQGVGAAMLMACSPALVVDTFPVSQRGKVMGMVGTMVAAGLTMGPALGGIILEYFSWRVIFFINIPIGIVSTVWAARILKGGRGDMTRDEPLDWAGSILIIICLCAFILALSNSYDWGFASWRTISLWILAMVSGIALVRIEKDQTHPVFEPSLAKIRLFMLPIVSAVILFAGLFMITFLMPFFLVHPGGFSIDRAGFIMVIPFVMLFFMSPMAGMVADRIGSRLLCTLGMLILTAALIFLSTLDADAPFNTIAWRLALVGVGIAVFVPPNSTIALNSAPAEHRGIAAGTIATARNLGMVIGVALAGLIFNTIFHSMSNGLNLKLYSESLEPYFMGAFKYTMVAGAIITSLGIVITYLRGRG